MRRPWKCPAWARPSRTPTPTPTVATLTWLCAISLPSLASASMTTGVITATSKASPPSMRFFRPPAVSLSTVTLWPVSFSKSGMSASTTCMKAPAVSTLISAPFAAEPKPAKNAISSAKPNFFGMAILRPRVRAIYTIWRRHGFGPAGFHLPPPAWRFGRDFPFVINLQLLEPCKIRISCSATLFLFKPAPMTTLHTND